MAKIVQKLRSIMVKKPKKEIFHSKKSRKIRLSFVLNFHLPNFHLILLAGIATRRSCRTKKPNKFLSQHRELLREYYNGKQLQKRKPKMIQVTKTVQFSPKIEYFYFISEKIARYDLRASKQIWV